MEDRRKKDCTGKYRDTRGRVLKTGETQQRDGRYRYTYVGLDGKPQCVYSWKLEETDKLPAGKRPCESLRVKEKQVIRLKELGIKKIGDSKTVIELIEYQRENQGILAIGSINGEQTVENFIRQNELGSMMIKNVSKDYLQKWLKNLQKSGKGYSTIYSYWKLLCKAFKTAVNNKWLIDNPTSFVFTDYVINDSEERIPLTKDEKEKFLGFIKGHKLYSKYYDEIYVLFYTGLRISEFCGLTIDDINFDKGIIHIDHQLRDDNGYYIKPLKGQRKDIAKLKTRDVPMMKDVAECLKRMIRNRGDTKNDMVVKSIDKRISDKSGFININNQGNIKTPKNYEDMFSNICKAYNKEYPEHPLYVTPHICRHTFCSSLAGIDMNIVKLQRIMGHIDISVTLDYYTKFNVDEIVESCTKFNDVDW